MRILLTVCYDGTDFVGYQIQPNGRSVEEVLNEAIYKATGERVKSIASGRTDSGVHALGQKVHFDTFSLITFQTPTLIPSTSLSILNLLYSLYI